MVWHERIRNALQHGCTDGAIVIWRLRLSYIPDEYCHPNDHRTCTLEDFPPKVLLDSSTRSLDLSELELTSQHFRSICSTVRATDHIQEVSFMRRDKLYGFIDGPTQNELWAWIAFGILHRDSRSTLKRFNFGGDDGSIESMDIVARILASPHPGTELVMAIAPKLKTFITSKGVPLPMRKRLYILMKAKTDLFKKPCDGSSTVFSATSCMITEEMQWKVMVKLSNDWTCILVPAYGVAWIPTDVILVGHEEPSVVFPGDRPKTLIKRSDWQTHNEEDVHHLLPMIEDSHEYLKMDSEEGLRECLDSILSNCPNLKYLNIDNNDLACPQLILKAYQQDQSKIESLMLGFNTGKQQSIVSEMVLLLADPSAKALRHFSICIDELDLPWIDNLIASCRSNRTLEVLKVITVCLDDILYQQVKAKLDVLNGELLAISNSSRIKWVFLSVVMHHRVARDNKATGNFDTLIISRIFQYAGSSVRRNVVVVDISL